MIKKEFGTTKSGELITSYIFENSQRMKMIVTDYGATLTQLWIPDQDGNLIDVVLGYDSLLEYENNDMYFGATIGRSANRIENACFNLSDIEYMLARNERMNNLHSGPDGYHLRTWLVEELTDNKITLSLTSPDNDQGYPGNLTVKVTYELTEVGVKIYYTGKSDQLTLFNPTNHTYFNLNGHNSGKITNHLLKINGEKFTPVADKNYIPTGEIQSVSGTPMDFTEMKRVGYEIDDNYTQLQLTDGYDHNYVIDSNLPFFAKLIGDKTGISMKVATNLPGVQFYTGNFIENVVGKENTIYEKRAGLCLETQFYPNAINEKSFLSPILEPNKVVKYWTVYDFSSSV